MAEDVSDPQVAWSEFCTLLEQAGALLARDDLGLTDLDRAEGLRYLGRLLQNGLVSFLDNPGPRHPRFSSLPAHCGFGLDNPDNVYSSAGIDPNLDYRITGTRGTISYLSFAAQNQNYAARDRITGWIDRAVEDGATLSVDGRGASGDGPEGSSFVGPTILDDVSRDAPIVQEEVFGPVLTVVRAASLDEAIEIVNASRFGNGTSIFTENAAAVRRYRHEVEAGMIGVNIGVAAPVAFFPFSGWKDSFLGDLHAHGGDAIDFYTRKTTVTSRWYSDGETGKFFVE